MTDRKELERLKQNALKSGRTCSFFINEEGWIESVFYNGKMTNPLSFAEMERSKPKWYETLQERWIALGKPNAATFDKHLLSMFGNRLTN